MSWNSFRKVNDTEFTSVPEIILVCKIGVVFSLYWLGFILVLFVRN